MKNLLISLLLLAFSPLAYANELDLEARMTWPKEYSRVGQVVVYFLQPTGYRLYLDDGASDIAELRVAALPDESVTQIKDILLDVLPDQYVLVVDTERKLISFAAQ